MVSLGSIAKSRDHCDNMVHLEEWNTGARKSRLVYALWRSSPNTKSELRLLSSSPSKFNCLLACTKSYGTGSLGDYVSDALTVRGATIKGLEMEIALRSL
jgi:hypothetical protein